MGTCSRDAHRDEVRLDKDPGRRNGVPQRSYSDQGGRYLEYRGKMCIILQDLAMSLS